MSVTGSFELGGVGVRIRSLFVIAAVVAVTGCGTGDKPDVHPATPPPSPTVDPGKNTDPAQPLAAIPITVGETVDAPLQERFSIVRIERIASACAEDSSSGPETTFPQENGRALMLTVRVEATGPMGESGRAPYFPFLSWQGDDGTMLANVDASMSAQRCLNDDESFIGDIGHPVKNRELRTYVDVPTTAGYLFLDNVSSTYRLRIDAG